MIYIKFVIDKDKQIKKSKETMEIYAPLADRMGMNRIRDELEDLAFEILNPEASQLLDYIIKDNNGLELTPLISLRRAILLMRLKNFEETN